MSTIPVDSARLSRFLVDVQAVENLLLRLNGDLESPPQTRLLAAVEGFEEDVIGQYGGENARIALDDQAEALGEAWALSIIGSRSG